MVEIPTSGKCGEGEIISTNFALAFTHGLRVHDESGEELNIQVVQAGELLITSGSVVACDPFWLNSAPEAYTTQVPRGRFPVFLSIAEFIARKDRRVACAKLRFSPQEVVRWEMAVVPGQDVSTLHPGEIFCFGVDAGTSCFVDLDVVKWFFEQAGVHDLEMWRGLPESMADRPGERSRLVNAVHTYFHTVVLAQLDKARTSQDMLYGETILNNVTGGNLVLFSSGWGDGCYASYFGYAADGSLACLVTDFGVLFNVRP